MPRVPEPLGAPKSLGGLAGRAGIDLDVDSEETVELTQSVENKNLEALRERTEDWSEDIGEANIIQKVISDENIIDIKEEDQSSEVDVELGD